MKSSNFVDEARAIFIHEKGDKATCFSASQRHSFHIARHQFQYFLRHREKKRLWKRGKNVCGTIWSSKHFRRLKFMLDIVIRIWRRCLDASNDLYGEAIYSSADGCAHGAHKQAHEKYEMFKKRNKINGNSCNFHSNPRHECCTFHSALVLRSVDTGRWSVWKGIRHQHETSSVVILRRNRFREISRKCTAKKKCSKITIMTVDAGLLLLGFMEIFHKRQFRLRLFNEMEFWLKWMCRWKWLSCWWWGECSVNWSTYLGSKPSASSHFV